jgi:hypothetical protein
MSWIPKNNASTEAAVPNVRVPAFSLEIPLVMSVRRLPAPVYGTLIELTAHRARIRSLVLMDRGTELEFELDVPGNEPITVVGRVESRHNAVSGARFEYTVLFTLMSETQIDKLARAVRDLERKAAASRSIAQSIGAIPTTDRARRSSYRVLASFPISYRRDGAEWAQARVVDISSTGVRVNCDELVAIGTLLDIRLTLPSSVLDVYPEETLVIELAPNGSRRVGTRPDMRRPFDEMALRGRIVTRFQPVRDREVYGLAFVEIDGYHREEIARFTHALQLSKIRAK